jgi:two-component sensor histidine kinase
MTKQARPGKSVGDASRIATPNLMKVSLVLVNRELIHRVGNLLAVAQGIIRLSYNASLSTVAPIASTSPVVMPCLSRKPLKAFRCFFMN